MPRNPDWSAEDAAAILDLIAADEAAVTPFLFDDPEPSLDISGRTVGTLDPQPGPDRDVIDFITVDLAADGIYSFLANGPAPMQLSIFDSEGYLLLSMEGADFGLDPAFGTIYQFLPDMAGTHHILVSFVGTDVPGSYGFSGEADFGELDPETGNTGPLARDILVGTTTFQTTRIEPGPAGFDADGDPLEVVSIDLEPRDGIAFIVDGDLYYRSGGAFAGVDRIEFTLSDGQGGTDRGVAVLPVLAEPSPDGEVTTAEAQLIAYLYEAGLDRNGNIDEKGLNFWIDSLAAGLSVETISGKFLGSGEFEAAFGDPEKLSDRELVQQLYRNVLDREGEEGGIVFWEGQLALPAVSRADLLTAFAQSAENALGSPEVAALALGEEGDWGFG